MNSSAIHGVEDGFLPVNGYDPVFSQLVGHWPLSRMAIPSKCTGKARESANRVRMPVGRKYGLVAPFSLSDATTSWAPSTDIGCCPSPPVSVHAAYVGVAVTLQVWQEVLVAEGLRQQIGLVNRARGLFTKSWHTARLSLLVLKLFFP